MTGAAEVLWTAKDYDGALSLWTRGQAWNSIHSRTMPIAVTERAVGMKAATILLDNQQVRTNNADIYTNLTCISTWKSVCLFG